MRLTELEQKLVEDNHNLIYWYANMTKLDLSEWYDLLAIELCYTAQKYDAERGAFSNYFKTRCDSLTYKEYMKTKAQKNAHNGMYSLNEAIGHVSDDDVENVVELEQIFEVENGEILRLKANGYTQAEIADRLGVTQSYISKILGRLKKEYYDR